MKIKYLVTSIGCATILATVPAQAGDSGPIATGPIPTAPSGSLLGDIDSTLSTGYDSSYMFRGFNFGEEALWTALDMSLPITLGGGDFTLSWGAWYINPTDPAQNGAGAGALDDELDLYVSLGTTVGAVDVALGYTHYHFPEQGPAPDNQEVGINLGTSVGIIDLGLGYYYNFDLGDSGALGAGTPGVGALDHYWEVSAGTGWDLSDRTGLSIGVTAAWYSTDFSHLQYSASLPIQITDNVVLEPYVAYLDNRNSGQIENLLGADNDDFFGGVSLSVSF